MCGRYRIKDTDFLSAEMRKLFNIPDWVNGPPRYNVSPSQDCPSLTQVDEEGDVLVPSSMRWGIKPTRGGAEIPGFFLVNIRAENAATNKLVGAAVQKRRCLIAADGFYEWLRLDERTKFPFDIHLKGNRPFVMAAVYEKATESKPATFAVLTTRPNAEMAKIHDRMPAILGRAQALRWVRPGPITVDEIAQITEPHPADDMEFVPIGTLVNSPKNDMPEILAPVAFELPPKREKQEQGELF